MSEPSPPPLGDAALLSLRGRSFAHAITVGHYGIAEDFASWMVLRALEGQAVTFIERRMIDFLREQGIANRSPKGDFSREGWRKRARREAAETRREDERRTTNPTALMRAASEASLNTLERVVFLLHLQFGLELTELGAIFGTKTKEVNRVYLLALSKLRGRE